MHEAVQEWVARYASRKTMDALDIGGRDINGHVRHLFPGAKWTVLDLSPGNGVDIVADAAKWEPDRQYDLILCTEVFEHTNAWPQIVATAGRALNEGGRAIFTCAGPGRPEHSAIDGEMRLLPGEWYENVTPRAMTSAMASAGFTSIEVEHAGHDVRSFGIKR